MENQHYSEQVAEEKLVLKCSIGEIYTAFQTVFTVQQQSMRSEYIPNEILRHSNVLRVWER